MKQEFFTHTMAVVIEHLKHVANVPDEHFDFISPNLNLFYFFQH